MPDTRSWIDKGQQAILALGKNSAGKVQQAASSSPSLQEILPAIGEAELAKARGQREVNRYLFGDPSHQGSRNPGEIFSEEFDAPRH